MKHIFLLIFIVVTSININADDVNKIVSAYTIETSDLQVSSYGIVAKLCQMTIQVHVTKDLF
jgi:hypothetical protein